MGSLSSQYAITLTLQQCFEHVRETCCSVIVDMINFLDLDLDQKDVIFRKKSTSKIASTTWRLLLETTPPMEKGPHPGLG